MMRLRSVVLALFVPCALTGCTVSEDPQMKVFASQLKERGFNTIISQQWDKEAETTKSIPKSKVARNNKKVTTGQNQTMEIVVQVKGCDVKIERQAGADADRDKVDEIDGREEGIAIDLSPSYGKVADFLKSHRGDYLCYRD